MLIAADTPLWVPLVTLIAGALAALGANYLLKRRDESREARGAARLVDAELAEVQWALEKVVEKSKESHDDSYAEYRALHYAVVAADLHVTDEAWRDTRLILARLMGPDHQWDLLRNAYSAMALWDTHNSTPASKSDAAAVEQATLGLLFDARVAEGVLLPSIGLARKACQDQTQQPPVKLPKRPSAKEDA